MSNRLSNHEIAYFENITAVSLRISSRVKRLVYAIDDPDLLAELIGLAHDAATIRQQTLTERDRRKAEKELSSDQ